MMTASTRVIKRHLEFISPLRYSGYRRYFVGLVGQVFGWQMLMAFSFTWLMFDLTNDERDLGYLGAAVAVPALSLNLFGGVLSDKLDPKRMVVVADAANAIQLSILALLVFSDLVEPWHVLVAAAVFGSMEAFDNPARNSVFPRLIPQRDLGHAVTLNYFLRGSARVISPIVAGFIVARAGVAPTILLAAIGYLGMAVLIQTVRMATVERASGNVLREMISGFAFVKENNIYLHLIGMTYVVTCWGTSYIFLMPVFAEEVLAVGSEGMGWLIATSGIGGLIGIFASSAFGKVRWRGWAIFGSAVGYGICLMCFALSPWFWLSLIAVFCAGLCVFFYLPTLMATIHSMVPNEYRGRVMGLYVTSFNLTPLGALQAGFLSSYFNPQFAVAFGGSLVVLFALALAHRVGRLHSVGEGVFSVD